MGRSASSTGRSCEFAEPATSAARAALQQQIEDYLRETVECEAWKRATRLSHDAERYRLFSRGS